MENLLNIAEFIILLVLIPLLVFLYPVMGFVFLVRYFKTKNRRLLWLSLLILVPIIITLGLFVWDYHESIYYNNLIIDFLVPIFIFFMILPIILGVIFIKRYSKTKIKKYRLLGLGYFLIPVTVLLWGLVSFLVAQLSKPDELLCYAPPPPDHLFFNNTLSPELTSYKESLVDKFASRLPESVVEKISDS